MITENFLKNSCAEFIHLKNRHKSFQKFKITRTHYFINRRSYLTIFPTNRQKHLLVDTSIEWIFLHAEVFKIFISKKKSGYRENGETRNGVGQIVFAISMEKLHTIR